MKLRVIKDKHGNYIAQVKKYFFFWVSCYTYIEWYADETYAKLPLKYKTLESARQGCEHYYKDAEIAKKNKQNKGVVATFTDKDFKCN